MADQGGLLKYYLRELGSAMNVDCGTECARRAIFLSKKR